MKRLGLSVATIIGCGLVLIVTLKFVTVPGVSASSEPNQGIPAVVGSTPGKAITIPQNTNGVIDWQLVGATQSLSAASVTSVLDKIEKTGGPLYASDRVTAVYYGLGYNGVTSPETGKYLGPQDVTLPDGEVVHRFQGRPTMIVMYQPTSTMFDWTAVVIDVQSGQALEQLNHRVPS